LRQKAKKNTTDDTVCGFRVVEDNAKDYLLEGRYRTPPRRRPCDCCCYMILVGAAYFRLRAPIYYDG